MRIYGVPLHAWNIDFFKLCVFDCGRLLKIDDITMDRDRCDYARILLSTSSLEIINRKACIMVDGVLFDFQIIEEWGFSLGEDACLLDEESTQDDVNSERPDYYVDDAGRGDVDDLMNHFSETPKKDENITQGKYTFSDVSVPVKDITSDSGPKAPSMPQGVDFVTSTSALEHVMKDVPDAVLSKENIRLSAKDVGDVGFNESRDSLKGEKRVIKRTSSCPPVRVRSTTSGLWSVEWANRRKHDDFGAFSVSKPKDTDKCFEKGPTRVSKKKGGGYLKRIARLSKKDRKEILRALRRTSKKRRAASEGNKAKALSTAGQYTGESQSSVNNEWQNWLVLHGNTKVRPKDVCDIGKVVGLKFTGDKNNMFDVLSGVGRKNNGGSGNGN